MENVRIKAADHIINYCGNLSYNEKILFIYDDSTIEVLPYLVNEAQKNSQNLIKIKIPIMSHHGQEPSIEISDMMKNSDLIIALTKMSLAHTKARLDACNSKSRYLSLAEYSLDILENKAILGVNKNIIDKLNKMEDIFNDGTNVFIETKLGTKLNLDISTRRANNCPGYVVKSGDLGSPPDMEVNISPIENKSNGIIIIDGSITHPSMGLIKDPIELDIRNGSIKNFSNTSEGNLIKNIMQDVNDKKAYVLAELGIGFNTEAELNGTMLIDEGAANCIHFGFGSNSTVGGLNEISFHLDYVMKNANLYVDNKLCIREGIILI